MIGRGQGPVKLMQFMQGVGAGGCCRISGARGCEVVYGSVDAALIRAYQLPPVMASHYGGGAAFRQKVGTLAGRRETQARDIFDLHHLIAIGAAVGAAKTLDPAEVERARLNAMAVDFGTFKSQVLAYLSPEDQPRYDSPPVWDTLVLEVVEGLGGRRA